MYSLDEKPTTVIKANEKFAFRGDRFRSPLLLFDKRLSVFAE